MRKSKRLTVVTRLLEDCDGYEDGDEVSRDRELAKAYYFMRARGDEVPGRSAVVDGTVSAMVEAVTAQMMDAFSSGAIVKFEPDGPDDREQVQTESDVVAAFVMGNSNNGFLLFEQGIKDALLERTGVGKVWVREDRRARTREYRRVTPDAAGELMAERPGVRLEQVNFRNGTLTVSEVTDRKELCVDMIAPENFVYTKDWPNFDLQEIPCAGERHLDTRSDMIKVHGFDADAVAELTAYAPHKAADTSRNPRNRAKLPNRTGDGSLDVIEWFELCVLMDTDGDGIAERWHVSVVPNQALLSEDAGEGVYYAPGAALINPHRLLGISLFDKLKQTADERTALRRQKIDNGNAVNKSRLLYLERAVNGDDLEDGRINSAVPVGGNVQDVRQAAVAFVVPDMSQGIAESMAQTARDRSELGGASLDLQTAQAQLTDRVGSQGVDRIYSVAEQLARLMTRNIGETLIRGTFLLAHRTLRENFRGPVTIRRNGRPVTTDPSQWPERRVVTVKPGLSASERAAIVAGLDYLINANLTLLKEGQGDIMVNKRTLYALLMERSRLVGVPIPEEYILDPASKESQAAEQGKAQAQQKERQAQGKLMDMALGLEQLRVAIDKRAGDADRVLEFFKAILTAESSQAAVVGGAAKDFELERMKAENLEREAGHNAALLAGVDRATGALKEARGGAQAA